MNNRTFMVSSTVGLDSPSSGRPNERASAGSGERPAHGLVGHLHQYPLHHLGPILGAWTTHKLGR
jgi:hypothetical protein